MSYEIPIELLEKIKNNEVVPFVGSGISAGVKDVNGKDVFLRWEDMLLSSVKMLEKSGNKTTASLIPLLLEEAETSKDYLNIADRIEKKLSSDWQNFLNMNFKKELNDNINKDTLDIPKEIWKLGKLIITTNYDNVLRWANNDKSNLITWNIQSIAGQVKSLKEYPKSDTLWHLHGTIDDLDNIVLTSESYERVYGEYSKNEGAVSILRRHIETKSFIFLGFSLDDIYLKLQLKTVKKLFGKYTGPHYIFIKEEYKSDLSDLGDIRPIFVKDYNTDYLKKLRVLTSHIDSTKSIQRQKKVKEVSAVLKIGIYYANPLNRKSILNFSKINNVFKKYSAEFHFKILNEDELLDANEYDYNLFFTDSKNQKIIIEDEYFLQKTITINEWEEYVPISKCIFFLSQNIEGYILDSKIVKTESQLKKELSSVLHKQLCLNRGTPKIYYADTPLPTLIDKKNLINFVGRDTDIENIIKKILNIKNENQILLIKGSGGIGKTATISKAVLEISKRGKFRDGIKFVQCEFVKDSEDFKSKITDAFDMNNAINFEKQLRELRLEEERLIILDNIETLLYLNDTDRVKKLIGFISDYANIVLTSREILDFEYEDVYLLRALSTDEAEELFIRYYELKKYNKRLLREEILENLLNNNPLAIKLVTKNLPKGKNLNSIKQELENSFFELTSDDVEKIFEKEPDINIEKTKSLFQSINYSYAKLNEKEKLALEILSLFPDGLIIESLKMFYSQKIDKKNNLIKQNTQNFSDKDIRSLEDKSLIIINNGLINLQSIIGRFADSKFNNRKALEKKKFYNIALIYNKIIIDVINDNHQKDSVSARIFNKNENNFLKSLDYVIYVNEGKFEKDFLIEYINGLSSNFTFQSLQIQRLIKKLENIKTYLDESFILNTILYLEYFLGNFDISFKKIRNKISLEKILEVKNRKEKEKLAYYKLQDIYLIEGNHYQICQNLNVPTDIIPTSVMIQLGEYTTANKVFNSTNFIKNTKDFFYYEFQLNNSTLDIEELESYLKSIFKSQHIEKVQVSYTLLKADKTRVSLKYIKKLIEINPFTSGIKELMIAIKKEDEESKDYFERAINMLYHVKYYYVEAIFLYCKYLKKNDDSNYLTWLNRGKNLSTKYYYRYLLHQFICLDKNNFIVYDENLYPLPKSFDYKYTLRNV